MTSAAQTISDLRATVSAAQLRRAIRRAEAKGLRTGLEQPREATRSELEHRFLRLCERHRLPRPAVNQRVGRFEVDFLWAEHRVIVETDGYRYHRGRTAFEDDRRRDLELRDAGFDVVRLTYRQVTDEPTRVISSLKRALSTRDPR